MFVVLSYYASVKDWGSNRLMLKYGFKIIEPEKRLKQFDIA